MMRRLTFSILLSGVMWAAPAYAQDVERPDCRADGTGPGSNLFIEPEEQAFTQAFACPNAFIHAMPEPELSAAAADDSRYDIFDGILGMAPLDRVIDRRGLNAEIDISKDGTRLGASWAFIIARKFIAFDKDGVTSDLPYRVKIAPKISTVLDGENGPLYGFEEPVSGVRLGGTLSIEIGRRRSVETLRTRFSEFRRKALKACGDHNRKPENASARIDCTDPVQLNSFVFASSQNSQTDEVTFARPDLYEELTHVLWDKRENTWLTAGVSAFYTPRESFEYRNLTPLGSPEFSEDFLDPDDPTGRKLLKEKRKPWEISGYVGWLPSRKAYLGATIEVGRSYRIAKPARDVQLCPPPAEGVPVSTCIKSNIAAPEGEKFLKPGIEGRFRVETRSLPDFGFAPRVTHDLESHKWGFDFPVYVPIGKKDELKAGFRVAGEEGGEEPADWVASLFIGANLDILK